MAVDTQGSLPTAGIARRAPRILRAALLRIATVALGASLPAGLLGALLCGASLLMGEGGHARDLPEVFVTFALCAMAGATLLVTLEEVALRSSRPGLVVSATLLALTMLGLCLTAGFADGSDADEVAATIGLVAAPLTLLGLCRVGGLPGLGGAPMLGRLQVLLLVLVAALEGALLAGPLDDVFDLPSGSGTAALLVPLIALGAATVGALPCLALGDALAERWELDPRPEPAGGALARGLGGLLVALLLLAIVAVLVATRGLQVAVDVWRPRVVVHEPAEGDRVDGDQVLLRGRVEDANVVRAMLVRDAGTEPSLSFSLPLKPDGSFEVRVPLVEGYNHLRVVAEDASRNQREVGRVVQFVPPWRAPPQRSPFPWDRR